MFLPGFLTLFASIPLFLCQETDPNGINKVFQYIQENPNLITSLVIKENQLISRENEKCVQYDYVYFEWINTGIPNPFPDVIDGREYCTAVSCEDVFGPEESVDCSLFF